MAVGGLAAEPLAELRQPPLVAAVDDDLLDRRQRLADAQHLRLGLPAAADHAERPRAGAGEMPRSDGARCAGAQAAEPVRLDHGGQLRRVEREEHDNKGCPSGSQT